MESSDQQIETMARQYGRLIRSAVARVAGAGAEALCDDIEQQVLVELWKQMSRRREIRHPSSYLYRAAVRATVRAMRQDERRQEADAEVTAEQPPRPDEEVASKELGARLGEIIQSLLPDRRRAVRGHLAGLGVREMMTSYGWPYQRARNLVARGMADLRRRLLEEGLDV